MKTQAIICDLDGTLALITDRNPYDASKCEQDLVNFPVYKVLQLFFADGYDIVFVSGRQEQHRPQTEAWLKKQWGRPYVLYMRQTEDTRADDLVKQEIYQSYIQDKYNVLFVLDDRPRVIRKWKELGLTVFNVNGTCEEF